MNERLRRILMSLAAAVAVAATTALLAICQSRLAE